MFIINTYLWTCKEKEKIITFTYKTVKNAADKMGKPYADVSIPENHFAVTTEIMGITTTYLFKGVLGDEGAKIIGRQEIHGESSRKPVYYHGNGLKGGHFSEYRNLEEAFQSMV